MRVRLGVPVRRGTRAPDEGDVGTLQVNGSVEEVHGFCGAQGPGQLHTHPGQTDDGQLSRSLFVRTETDCRARCSG